MTTSEMPIKYLGFAVKYIRERRGMPIAEVQRRMREVTNRAPQDSYFTRVERGIKSLGFRNLLRFSHALEVEPWRIMRLAEKLYKSDMEAK